ncbi:roadblock/LC7 domain-containing protein [Actinomadura parmotrematis]|uniref:Roadblock/LC7 domain-containing protein n=1 Tax=Actinomadura parmotrematis TaxID=2864039 RepID=A0ABS7G3L0_9ACTN|nr:roadblock/LC7 domain-containing protein [Actinomadura parmotrematis]MBW8486402.1 roadblock/LC7 domain-containing protein [Actinomadura parmotrematis]
MTDREQAFRDGDAARQVDEMMARLPGVDRAVVLSRAGLVIAASAGLGQERAEHLSALVSGTQGLARGACQRFGGGELLQTVIEMDKALLFIVSAGEAVSVAALGAADADAGAIVYELTALAERLARPAAQLPPASGAR